MRTRRAGLTRGSGPLAGDCRAGRSARKQPRPVSALPRALGGRPDDRGAPDLLGSRPEPRGAARDRRGSDRGRTRTRCPRCCRRPRGAARCARRPPGTRPRATGAGTGAPIAGRSAASNGMLTCHSVEAGDVAVERVVGVVGLLGVEARPVAGGTGRDSIEPAAAPGLTLSAAMTRPAAHPCRRSTAWAASALWRSGSLPGDIVRLRSRSPARDEVEGGVEDVVLALRRSGRATSPRRPAAGRAGAS